MKNITLTAKDGYKLSIIDHSVDEPIAVVQIAHGMEEHQQRYTEFAQYLNKQGYAVITADMRGHGKNAEQLGFFAEKDGWKLLVSDMLAVRRYIEHTYPDKPVYLFAHSMGTIISRVLLQKHSSKYQKVVLAGYPNYQLCSEFGVPIAALLSAIKGKKYHSAFLKDNTTGVFNKHVKNPRTTSDWLTTVPEKVDEFINDPLCGQGFTCSAYGDLYKLLTLMHRRSRYVNIDPDIRILMLRGTDDPCTGGEKGAAASRRTLEEAGFAHLSHKDYVGMRHELINEERRHEVFSDITDFFSAN